MKSYPEVREEAQNKRSELFKTVGLFFAFSNEQFLENKTPLKENEKYVSIGMGGYLPKGNVEAFTKGMDEISKWEKAEIKRNKELKYQHIAFELANHECYYTNDISDALNALPYTREEVLKVYVKEREKNNC